MLQSRYYIRYGILLVFLIGAVILFIGNQSTQKSVCRNCNVILITIDSVNNNHLGLYGYKRDTSPNLDAWSKNALVFNQYITTSDLTPVTQTSIQTGRYPSNSGVVSFSSYLPDDVPTLPEILKKEGYTTAVYGSAPEYYEEGVSGWQLRRQNFQRGFDEYFDEYFENQVQSKPPTPYSGLPSNYIWPQKERGLPTGVIDWLSHAPAQKFFLWIPIGTVHWPYNDNKPIHFANPAYEGILKNDAMNWRTPSQFKRIYRNQLWPKDGAPVKLSQDDLQFVVDRYDDGIYLTDQFLGEIFRAIEQKGLTKNTIVIITTEHGEEFGEHGYLAHYDIFDPETRVPLLIKIPGLSQKRITQQVSTVDILPTLLDAIGIRPPSKFDGKSFWNYLAEKKQIPENFRPYAFIERTPLMETLIFDSVSENEKWLIDFLVADGVNHYRDVAVRTNEWKLIFRESRAAQEKYSWWRRLSGDKTPIPEYELYHLSDTPLEQKNVIDAYPKIASELKRVLGQWVAAGADRRKLIPPDFEETSLSIF